MKPTFVAFYPSDWRAGVAGLDHVEELVFFRLCCHQWEKGEGPTTDWLVRLCPTLARSDVEAAVRTLADAGKIVDDGGRWSNARAAEEHARAGERRESARRAARSRWGGG